MNREELRDKLASTVDLGYALLSYEQQIKIIDLIQAEYTERALEAIEYLQQDRPDLDVDQKMCQHAHNQACAMASTAVKQLTKRK